MVEECVHCGGRKFHSVRSKLFNNAIDCQGCVGLPPECGPVECDIPNITTSRSFVTSAVSNITCMLLYSAVYSHGTTRNNSTPVGPGILSRVGYSVHVQCRVPLFSARGQGGRATHFTGNPVYTEISILASKWRRNNVVVIEFFSKIEEVSRKKCNGFGRRIN